VDGAFLIVQHINPVGELHLPAGSIGDFHFVAACGKLYDPPLTDSTLWVITWAVDENGAETCANTPTDPETPTSRAMTARN
jgi:hypothetical protein